MLAGPCCSGVPEDLGSARRVLKHTVSSCIMSQRAHFWLRIVGLAVILAAEFGPRLWTPTAASSPSTATATADLR